MLPLELVILVVERAGVVTLSKLIAVSHACYDLVHPVLLRAWRRTGDVCAFGARPYSVFDCAPFVMDALNETGTARFLQPGVYYMSSPLVMTDDRSYRILLETPHARVRFLLTEPAICADYWLRFSSLPPDGPIRASVFVGGKASVMLGDPKQFHQDCMNRFDAGKIQYAQAGVLVDYSAYFCELRSSRVAASTSIDSDARMNRKTRKRRDERRRCAKRASGVP